MWRCFRNPSSGDTDYDSAVRNHRQEWQYAFPSLAMLEQFGAAHMRVTVFILIIFNEKSPPIRILNLIVAEFFQLARASPVTMVQRNKSVFDQNTNSVAWQG